MPIWFPFAIAIEFLWFLIESKWMTVRLIVSAGKKATQTQTPAEAQTKAT